MTIETLEKELKEGKLNEIYLFYGQETYLIDTTLNIEQLISNLQTPCFGYPKKLVVVKNVGLFKREIKKKGANFADTRDKICEYLKENSDIIKSDNILIFIEESVDKGKMLTCLEDIDASVCNFEHQKMPNLVARLKAICKAYKVNIEDSTLKYFIECVRK